MHKEIALTHNNNSSEIIETIYIGGGTPSLLGREELQDLFIALRAKYTVAQNAEITLETNPDDISKSSLDMWLETGINRLSVGIQSFNDEELLWMNRAHNASQSFKSLDDIQAAGFTNFSADLIYGSPLQSNEQLTKNATIIFEKNIPHISAYALTVEPKTALAKMIALHTTEIDTDKQAEQFDLLISLTESNGYEQYEISNFAKPGYRSRHNSSYWQGKPYYGFGPSAHSYNGKNIRRWNVANNALYIEMLHKNTIPFEEETLTPAQQLNEYVMTSLRTSEGINVEKIKEAFGSEEAERVLYKSRLFIDQQTMLLQDNNLTLTKKGKFLADGIASALFGD